MNINKRDFIIAGLGISTGIIGTILTISNKSNIRINHKHKHITVSVGAMDPGNVLAFEWGGYSFYILKRSKKMLESLSAVENNLKDPYSERSIQPDNCKNQHRSIKKEYIVVYNLCTRVGHPLQVNNDHNKAHLKDVGFFCPLEGSRFDFAGRSFKGSPGGYNLHVPNYFFKDEESIVIDKDLLFS